MTLTTPTSCRTRPSQQECTHTLTPGLLPNRHTPRQVPRRAHSTLARGASQQSPQIQYLLLVNQALQLGAIDQFLEHQQR